MKYLVFLLIGLVSFLHAVQRDVMGHTERFSMFGDTVQVPRTPQVSVGFVYSIDPYDVVTTVSGTGSMIQTLARAELSTGASASSVSKLRSKDSVIYRPNHESEVAMTAIFPDTCVVGNHSVVGFGNGEGSILLGCIEDEFAISHFDGVVASTVVTQGDWNLDKVMTGSDEYGNKLSKSGFILDQTKMNIFRFTYAWFGIATITIEVFGGARYGWIPLHNFDYPNKRTYPHLLNPSVPMVAYTSNTTNTTDMKLWTSSWGASNLGEPTTVGFRQFSFEVAQTGISTESVIACGRNTSTFYSRDNHIPMKIKTIQAAVDGTKNVIVRAYINPVITGGTWARYNNVSSVVDANTTATRAGGVNVGTLALAKSDSDTMRFGVAGDDTGFTMNAGDTMCITAESGSNTDVNIVVFWDELF